MAHKKGGGSTKNGRDSNAKRRGVKKYGGAYVMPGHIIVRQKGTKFHPGMGVGMGRDFTIFAKEEGFVHFAHGRRGRKMIHVLPEDPNGHYHLAFDEEE